MRQSGGHKSTSIRSFSACVYPFYDASTGGESKPTFLQYHRTDRSVTAIQVDYRDTEPTGPYWGARRGSLIGRRPQLQRLDAELAEAADERLRVVLLLGEAGVGKTRLASEFITRHQEEVMALTARAYPLGATASLGLWVEALERRLRSFAAEDVLELCGGHVYDLASLLPSVRAVAPDRGSGMASAEPPRIRLLGALVSLLDRLSHRSVLVVNLDDVHLADGSSWEALNYLTHNLSDSRLLVLLSARPSELAEHTMASEVVRALESEGILTRTDRPTSFDE